MKEKDYLVLLSTFVYFGPKRTELLIKYFGNAKNTWCASLKELKKLGLNEKILARFVSHRNNLEPKAYFNRLKTLGIQTISKSEKGYPVLLKTIDSAPTIIYVIGMLKESDANAIAIVGSRKMSSYGKEVTEVFSKQLATCGLTIISGLARGIDTIAHKSALVQHGRTLAVIGCGLDNIYPPENTYLAKEIQKNGAVISEYPLGYPAMRSNFAARNRIIAALSQAVLVVEGRKKSGTLLTASAAAEFGRELFVIPGQITSPLSEAPNFLLQNGAKLALSPKDILDYLDLNLKLDSQALEKILPTTKKEGKLFAYLENEQMHIDELVRISSMDTKEVTSCLAMMEIKGIVKNVGSGIYKRA